MDFNKGTKGAAGRPGLSGLPGLDGPPGTKLMARIWFVQQELLSVKHLLDSV